MKDGKIRWPLLNHFTEALIYEEARWTYLAKKNQKFKDDLEDFHVWLREVVPAFYAAYDVEQLKRRF